MVGPGLIGQLASAEKPQTEVITGHVLKPVQKYLTLLIAFAFFSSCWFFEGLICMRMWGSRLSPRLVTCD